jgi:oligopeptide/dipeptide ABC transporter ATP-binding protein
LLKIENYSLVLKGSDNRLFPVLENLSLQLKQGQCLGLAGESGSGKSVLAMSIVGLIPARSIAEASGKIIFKNNNLLGLPESELRLYRGARIGFIFQEPMTAMNPLMTLYDQVAEVIYAHAAKLKKQDLDQKVKQALKLAGFSEPEKYYDSYPHQLSGGMRQRAMIGIGLAMEPELIIADEPTTAIDAGLQVQLVKELKAIVGKGERSMLFISHDLGVLQAISDQLAVLYAGNLMEHGETRQIMQKPLHPYSRDLLAALPRLVEQRILPRPIPGNLPQPDEKPAGCVYADRCREVRQKCREQRPEIREVLRGRFISCFFPVNLEEAK